MVFQFTSKAGMLNICMNSNLVSCFSSAGAISVCTCFLLNQWFLLASLPDVLAGSDLEVWTLMYYWS